MNDALFGKFTIEMTQLANVKIKKCHQQYVLNIKITTNSFI